jgi:hypothetical protein
MTTSLETLQSAIAPFRIRLLEHRLYSELRDLEDLQRFMEHHVFAVWDFMSLLKALQRELTCVNVPWVPTGDPAVRTLINQIVLGEESDTGLDGKPCSHFELYLQAMEEAGASTEAVRQFLGRLQPSLPLALNTFAPPCVGRFVGSTFELIQRGQLHSIAASFTFGREDLIPEMFGELVNRLNAQFPGRVETLRYYLDRHIALDGDEHGEMGRQMVARLCGDDPVRWKEATAAAVSALGNRLALWDGIADALQSAQAGKHASVP